MYIATGGAKYVHSSQAVTRSLIFDIPTTAGDTVAAPHVRRARLYPDVCTCLPHWAGRYQVSFTDMYKGIYIYVQSPWIPIFGGRFTQERTFMFLNQYLAV